MNSIETITKFLGWCTLLNFGLLIVASLFLTVMRGFLVFPIAVPVRDRSVHSARADRRLVS